MKKMLLFFWAVSIIQTSNGMNQPCQTMFDIPKKDASVGEAFHNAHQVKVLSSFTDLEKYIVNKENLISETIQSLVLDYDFYIIGGYPLLKQLHEMDEIAQSLEKTVLWYELLKEQDKQQFAQEILLTAVQNGYCDTVLYLLNEVHVPVDCCNNEKKSALHIAYENGNFGLACLLYDCGADARNNSETIAAMKNNPMFKKFFKRRSDSVKANRPKKRIKTDLQKILCACGLPSSHD